MNSNQVHNFIQYWLEEKYGVQMRVGFLYGYFAEDPFYKNGIRAIVEAIYEPKQVCTYDSFEIKDSDDQKMKVELIAESLGLQKLGIIISTHNDKVIFT